MKANKIIEFRRFKRFTSLNRFNVQVWRKYANSYDYKTRFYSVSKASINRLAQIANPVRVSDLYNWVPYLPK